MERVGEPQPSMGRSANAMVDHHVRGIWVPVEHPNLGGCLHTQLKSVDETLCPKSVLSRSIEECSMNPPSTAISFTRFTAIDLHKRDAVIGGISAQQRVILPPRRVEIDALACTAAARDGDHAARGGNRQDDQHRADIFRLGQVDTGGNDGGRPQQ